MGPGYDKITLSIQALSTEERRLTMSAKKEKEINSIENAGASCNDGGITVIELLERYISLKQGALGMLCNVLLRIERSRTLTTVWMGIAASCFWTRTV